MNRGLACKPCSSLLTYASTLKTFLRDCLSCLLFSTLPSLYFLAPTVQESQVRALLVYAYVVSEARRGFADMFLKPDKSLLKNLCRDLPRWLNGFASRLATSCTSQAAVNFTHMRMALCRLALAKQTMKTLRRLAC